MAKDIPIFVYSSMTGESNKYKAEILGTDVYINKTKSHNII